MEVGDDGLHQVELVAWHDDDLGVRADALQLVLLHVSEDGIQRLFRGEGVAALVGHPLRHLELGLRQFHVLRQLAADVVEALQRADRGGADRHDLARLAYLLDDTTADAYPFGVHLMVAYGGRFDRLEGAGPHMERHLLAADVFLAERLEHFGCEVKSGRRRRHGSLDFRVDGLVGHLVAVHRLTMQVGRDRQYAESVQNVREVGAWLVPEEAHVVGVSLRLQFLRLEDHLLAVHRHVTFQDGARLPLAGVADHAFPDALAYGLEGEYVVVGAYRLQTEDLDAGAGLLVEEEARLDDAGVVADQQIPLVEVLGDVLERRVGDVPVSIEQQLRFVPFL